ncbi:hypothetical protein [Gimesia sp.]|uniref:hypothetical protein n=1 Tax=Gimesia sp. TaxID=2024833 RepID=UPI003A95CEFF
MQKIHLGLVVLICFVSNVTSLLGGKLSPEALQVARQAYQAEKARIVQSLKKDSVIESLAMGTVRQAFKSAEARKSASGKFDTSLTIDYADHPIWSVKDNKVLTLHHRCSEGKMVGPTLRVKPGNLLRVRLINKLKNPNQIGAGSHDHSTEEHLTPLRFNTTNLHTHGLHMSPAVAPQSETAQDVPLKYNSISVQFD